MALKTTTDDVKGISPDAIEKLITIPVMAQSVAMQAATVVDTDATRTHIPLVTDDPDAAWVAEGEEIGASDPTVDDIVVTPAKVAGLTIITLTMYRFWARTSMRRRLWSRTWVMGDPLEYTGSAGELFRGFLISLPCFFLPAIFVFYIAPYAMEPVWAGWLSFGFYVLSVPLIAAAR